MAHSYSDPWRPAPEISMFTITYECSYCSMINVAYASWDPRTDLGPRNTLNECDRFVAGKMLDIRWTPKRLQDRTIPDVPPAIAQVAVEAYRCNDAGAHRGALMLARAVIESTAKTKGVEVWGIEAKIKAMAEMKLLTPGVVAAAHAVRTSGNAVAHGDFAEYAIEIHEDEAGEVLELMSMILRDVFQQPAIAARVSGVATKRKWRDPKPEATS